VRAGLSLRLSKGEKGAFEGLRHRNCPLPEVPLPEALEGRRERMVPSRASGTRIARSLRLRSLRLSKGEWRREKGEGCLRGPQAPD